MNYLKGSKNLVHLDDVVVQERHNPKENAEKCIKYILSHENVLFLYHKKTPKAIFDVAKQYISDELNDQLEQRMSSFTFKKIPWVDVEDLFTPDKIKMVQKVVQYMAEQGKTTVQDITLEEWKTFLGKKYDPRFERKYNDRELHTFDVGKSLLSKFQGANIYTIFPPKGKFFKAHAKGLGVKMGRVVEKER